MQHPLPGHILYGGDYNPEQWSEDIWQEDMRLMKLANVNMVSINIFSWTMLEPAAGQYHFEQLDRIMDLLYENGIAADLATATASPPTWMSRLYPSMLPVTREGVRLTHGSRQHYCPNSPDYRRKGAALVQRLAERYAKHPALKMWHLNNEYGCHVNQCYCDNCAAAFRVWLQERYQTLDVVNSTWGTTFWSQRYYDWEDILPPRLSSAQNNPGQVLDYWRFMNDSLLGLYRLEEDILRAVAPTIPLTTNLMVAFKPVDVYDWAKHMDIVSFDMYPEPEALPSWNALHHDIMRSAKGGRPHMVMEQSPSEVNWQPQNPHKRPGQMRLHSLQTVAHGGDGVLFFQWRQSKTGAEMYHAAVVTHEGNEHNRIFRQAAQVGAELAKLSPIVAGSRIQADVAILLDWDTWWAVEYLPGPSDRIKYMELVGKYYHAFHQQNVNIDVVRPDSDLSKYRVVVAPMLHMLHRGVAQNLEQFVSAGGTLLTTFYSGIVDENNHAALGGYPGELRSLLGVHVEEFDPLTPEMHNELVIKEGSLAGTYNTDLWGELVHLEGAQAIGVFGSDYYARKAALTVNKFGAGHAYYLATLNDADFLVKLAAELCQQAGIKPTLPISSEIEVTKRVTETGKEIYFLLNHTQQAKQITLPHGTFTSLLDDSSVQGEITIPAMDALVLQAE
ncbi:beta-galactosidase [Dictyobacter arantiisoli]|uniref:Beta-galactosidase n=1 Tax=Dictyobacter arantiisoli TaxID=2014874 RepID=A0A5A5TG59_9CHLR|nr:beta-galactosidase [Dictyobacter arantiisoli]GCF10561.1 beta-galactosidase [Dictyobacter arantiisoli]